MKIMNEQLERILGLYIRKGQREKGTSDIHLDKKKHEQYRVYLGHPIYPLIKTFPLYPKTSLRALNSFRTAPLPPVTKTNRSSC